MRTVFDGITNYPGSTIITEGIHADALTTPSYYSCGSIRYYGLLGTRAAFSGVQTYYGDMFLRLGLTIDDSGPSLAAYIDQDTVVYVYEADLGSLLRFKLSVDPFENAQKEQSTLFFVEISNKAPFLCNSDGHDD